VLADEVYAARGANDIRPADAGKQLYELLREGGEIGGGCIDGGGHVLVSKGCRRAGSRKESNEALWYRADRPFYYVTNHSV
jgi:hypothetical protein